MPSLKITPVPFRSSNLAIPTSPFSPRSPLVSHTQPKKPHYNVRHSRVASSPPKVQPPLQWMWQCHQCRQTYPLGATRRCLEDGHEFCAGTSVVKSRKHGNKKIVKKHRACTSEFDYAAWKALGEWRRDCLVPPTPSSKHGKDCWRYCDYPSECRWGSKLSQKTEQTSPTIPEAVSEPVELPANEVEKQQTPATTLDALLEAINHPAVTLQALLSPSIRRRASKTSKSPLSLQTVIEEESETSDEIMGEVVAPSPSPRSRAVAERIALLSADIYVSPPKALVQKLSSSFSDFNFGFDEDNDVVMKA